jgi:hypothetical protein
MKITGLSHFSDVEKIDPPFLIDQAVSRWDKPRGLWVSVDGEDDWPTWCKREEYRLDRLTNRFAVTLADDANVLHLSTVDEVLAFAAEHAGECCAITHAIDWVRVAKKYQGIIIAPYQWSLRSDNRTAWYLVLGLGATNTRDRGEAMTTQSDVETIPEIDLDAVLPCEVCNAPAEWTTCLPCGCDAWACTPHKEQEDARHTRSLLAGHPWVCVAHRNLLPYPLNWRQI